MMIREQLSEDDRLIAAFMGKTVYPDKIPAKNKRGWKYSYPWKGEYKDYEPFEVEYRSSWDWLMPVIEKIKKLEKDWPLATDDLLTLSIATPIEVVFEYIVIFIKWYNQNK